ncbi:MAG: NUDIX hydrolase [Brevefilum sp.]
MPKSDQGIHSDRYLVVPRTLIFLFDTNSRVLLLKGADDKRLWAGLYNGIGGHIERGEDIYEAACRELREETGLEDVDLHYSAQITVDVTAQSGVMIFVFKGISQQTSLTESSEGVLAWVPLDEIGGVPLVEDLPLLIPLVAAHKPSAAVLFGKYSYDDDGNLITQFR